MAKKSTTTTGNGVSRIRFVMLDAELPDGDISQITEAIQNALRPKQADVRLIQLSGSQDIDCALEDVLGTSEESVDEPEPTRLRDTKRTVNSKRSIKSLNVVDVDTATSPSLESYMASKSPANIKMKHLCVLAWFKEARNIEPVTVEQVYTCFKKLQWSTAAKDFSQPLRDLKADDLVGGNSKDGFTINHIGLDRVEKLSGTKNGK